MRSVASVFLCAVLVWMTGCSTSGPKQLYEGAALPASQQSVLIVSEVLDVMRIDEEKFLPLFGSEGSKEYALLPGAHRVVVRFQASYGNPEDFQELVRSSYYAAELTLEAGRRYRLQSEEPSDPEKARAYVQNLTLWLVDTESGERFDLSPAAETPREKEEAEATTLSMAGSTAAAVAVGATANASSAPAAASAPPAAASAAVAAPAAVAATAVAATGDDETLEQMKSLWNRASAEERAQFRDWAFPVARQ